MTVMILLAAMPDAVPDGRLFGLDLQTLFGICVQLLNACVLAAFLSYILYKPVQNFLRKRTDKINNQLKQAADDMAKANELKLQYEKNLEDIQRERNEILKAAQLLAIEKQREITNEAKKEAEAIREQAMTDIKREQEQLRETLRLHIIDVSSVMAGKFIARAMDKKIQNKLFDELMQELEEASWPS